MRVGLRIRFGGRLTSYMLNTQQITLKLQHFWPQSNKECDSYKTIFNKIKFINWHILLKDDITWYMDYFIFINYKYWHFATIFLSAFSPTIIPNCLYIQILYSFFSTWKPAPKRKCYFSNFPLLSCHFPFFCFTSTFLHSSNIQFMQFKTLQKLYTCYLILLQFSKHSIFFQFKQFRVCAEEFVRERDVKALALHVIDTDLINVAFKVFLSELFFNFKRQSN